MKKIYSIGGVALLVIAAFIGGFFSHTSPKLAGALYPSQLTSFPNGVQVGGGSYNQGFVQSGINSTTTTATASVLSATDLVGYSELHLTVSTGSLTLTLPASSTLSAFLPNAGDYTQFILYNATTTSGINVTLAAGTGTLLESASSTAATTAQRASMVTVLRKVNTDLIFMIQPFI